MPLLYNSNDICVGLYNSASLDSLKCNKLKLRRFCFGVKERIRRRGMGNRNISKSATKTPFNAIFFASCRKQCLQ